MTSNNLNYQMNILIYLAKNRTLVYSNPKSLVLCVTLVTYETTDNVRAITKSDDIN